MKRKKHRGQSAAFMRSINPHLKHHTHKARKGRISKIKSYSSLEMARRKRSFRRRSYSNMTQMIVGAGLAAVAEPFLDQLVTRFVPQASNLDDVIKLGLGFWLGKRSGIVGNAARALAIISAARLVQNLVAGHLIPAATQVTTTTATW